jgi:hypothetical protein
MMRGISRLLVLFALLGSGFASRAEIQRFTFSAEGSDVLTSRFAPILLSETAEGSFFNFKIGFETFETTSSGGFLDSLSISIYTTDPSRVALIATIDAFGASVTPENPGGVPLSSEAVRLTLAPHGGPIQAPTQFDFDMQVRVPAELAGQQVNAALDFFNNQNGAQSFGYAELPVVPEPGVMGLIGLGGFCFGVVRWKGRRR